MTSFRCLLSRRLLSSIAPRAERGGGRAPAAERTPCAVVASSKRLSWERRGRFVVARTSRGSGAATGALLSRRGIEKPFKMQAKAQAQFRFRSSSKGI